MCPYVCSMFVRLYVVMFVGMFVRLYVGMFVRMYVCQILGLACRRTPFINIYVSLIYAQIINMGHVTDV